MIATLRLVFLLILSTASVTTLASSAQNTGLPKSLIKADQKFQRCSQVRITKALFFKIVDVALYLPNCQNFDTIFDDQNKILRFAYLRKVSAKQFTDGAQEYLEKNLTAEQKAQCLPYYQQLNNAYQEVQKGDTYELLVAADKTSVSLNGNPIGSIEDSKCDNLYLNVWFGKESMDSGFQKLIEKSEHQAKTLNASLRASG